MNLYAKVIIAIAAILFLAGEELLAQPQVAEGWPQTYEETHRAVYDAIKIIEYNDEIYIVSASRHQLRVYTLEGELLPGYPFIFQEPYVVAGPKIGDLDGDSVPDIVIKLRPLFHRGFTTSEYHAFTLTGEEHVHLTRIHHLDRQIHSTSDAEPLVIDLDQDGNDDILYIADSLYAINFQNQNLEGFPWVLSESAHPNASLIAGMPPVFPRPFLVYVTHDSIHARYLDRIEEIAGWPIAIPIILGDPYSTELTKPVLIPYDRNWRLVIVSHRQLYVWDGHARLQNGFPVEIGINDDITALYVTVGDLDGDDSPDIIVRMNDRYIYAIGLNGTALEGYPYYIVQGSGGSSAGAFIHHEGEEAGIYILPLRLFPQGGCLHAFQGDGIYDDFPGEMVEDIAAGPCQVLGLYPDINNHRLLIAHNLMVGSLILWEYPMDLGGLVIDWQSAGNTNGGNRVYAPFPVVPHRNQPPRITEFEPNETDLQVVPGTEIQFRISGEDPDFDPLTYLFMLNEDTITHLNFASLNFAHPGRFLVTGRITDLEDLRDSVIWQVDVRPAERVPIDDDRQMTEFGEKSNELSNRGRKFAESEFTYKQSPLPEAFNVHFYPNPFNSRVTVRLELPEAMNLQVSIYNILGQEIATLAKGGYQVGICEWIFNGEGYSTGIYFLHVRSSKKADKIYKFVLLK